jgi:hypothetical protein
MTNLFNNLGVKIMPQEVTPPCHLIFKAFYLPNGERLRVLVP